MIITCDICYNLPEKLYQLKYSLVCSHRDLKITLFIFIWRGLRGNSQWVLWLDITYYSQHYIHILAKVKAYSCSLPPVAAKEAGKFSLAKQPSEERTDTVLCHSSKWLGLVLLWCGFSDVLIISQFFIFSWSLKFQNFEKVYLIWKK